MPIATQTQNQYFGSEKDLPNKMMPGSSFICIDTGSIYIYMDDSKPKLVSTKMEFLSQSEFDSIENSNNDNTTYFIKED